MKCAAAIVAIGTALASPAQAQTQSADQPAETSTAQSETDTDIVVVAQPSERGSIDRTSYIVRDNAEARASSALELLGRVPSVDVSPAGQVRLIGRSGVTVLIDGQEVPNASTLLRGMQGSQVERIEVATNPSAQFSARGTGGIINIVRRRSSGAGLGGSATGSVGNFGSYEAKVSPSWSGAWVSLSGSIGLGRSGNRGEVEEGRTSIGSGGEADRVERERSRGHNESQSASLKASVALAPKQSVSVDALLMEFTGHSHSAAEIVEGGVRSEERSTGDSDSRVRRIAADYRREGNQPGGQTSISASHSSLRFGSSRRFVTEGLDGTSLFRLRNDVSLSDSVFKLDHVRPSGDRRLSVGGQFQRNAEENRQRSVATPPAGEPVATDVSFAGEWSEAAAYATYQFPLLGGNVLAGSRVEARWYDIAGVSDDPAGGSHFFPSLHVERKLGRWLTANLSYSSRINWPSISALDPRLRFSDPATARAGNPDLRPEKTHSFELKLMARWGRHEADLTCYAQRTRDLRSDLNERVGEVLVLRPVNLGTRTSRGANLSVRGPLAKGLRYIVTGNVARETIGEAGLGGEDADLAGFDLAGFDGGGTRYGGSVQLIYQDGIEGRAGADQVRLVASYSGPIEAGFARSRSAVSANATWSHAVTDRLSAVLTASHLFGSYKSTIFGPGVISRTESRSPGPRVSLALTYGLGAVRR